MPFHPTWLLLDVDGRRSRLLRRVRCIDEKFNSCLQRAQRGVSLVVRPSDRRQRKWPKDVLLGVEERPLAWMSSSGHFLQGWVCLLRTGRGLRTMLEGCSGAIRIRRRSEPGWCVSSGGDPGSCLLSVWIDERSGLWVRMRVGSCWSGAKATCGSTALGHVVHVPWPIHSLPFEIGEFGWER